MKVGVVYRDVDIESDPGGEPDECSIHEGVDGVESDHEGDGEEGDSEGFGGSRGEGHEEPARRRRRLPEEMKPTRCVNRE